MQIKSYLMHFKTVLKVSLPLMTGGGPPLIIPPLIPPIIGGRPEIGKNHNSLKLLLTRREI